MNVHPLKTNIILTCLILFITALFTMATAQAQTVAVTGFTLINADTDAPIDKHNPILPGAVIDRTWAPHYTLSIEANTTGNVSKVIFGFQGQENYRTEGVAPYTLFGDQKIDEDINYAPAPYGTFKTGTYTVTATPYDQNDVPGEKASVTFTSQWIDFSIIDASTNAAVPGYEALTGEVTIKQDVLPEKWSIRANDASTKTRIMAFAFENDPGFQIEYVRPYAFFGDLSGDYFAAPDDFLKTGSRYKITATPFQNKPFIEDNSGNPVTMYLTLESPPEAVNIMLAGDSNTEGNVALTFNDLTNESTRKTDIRLPLESQNFGGIQISIVEIA